MELQNCFHCGNDVVIAQEIVFENKLFCCNGCKTVYEIFSQNDLSCYYDFEKHPGATPIDNVRKYDYLDNEEVVLKLLEFDEDDLRVVNLSIPHIHCSSCIWILENLQRLQEGIKYSQVNFNEKKVRITFLKSKSSLKEIVNLLCSIGYEPYISLENYQAQQKPVSRKLIYQLGIAFFSFGNIMLLSFPEYFDVNESWLDQNKGFFRSLIFALALPSFFYGASTYYVAAFKSIKTKIPSIDIPIALGIIVMFVRSVYDMFYDYGPGYFDSLTGLIFFMLLGKFFQQKTYNYLSFERDYKSYFPIASTKIAADKTESTIQVYDIQKGDRLLIRNQELIPVDGILISENTAIDYSFVTGEAVQIQKKSGEKVFAGGKVLGNVIEMEVLFSVSQSYLTQLWSNVAFQKKTDQKHKTITDKVSRYFTPILLVLAFFSSAVWAFVDWNIAFNVFTAVLIVACPCAIALTAPFTLGNILRIMGREKCYLKNAQVIEQMSAVDTIVFDKTGTITTNQKSRIEYEGEKLSSMDLQVLKSMLRGSNHPLSRLLYDDLKEEERLPITDFKEVIGGGLIAFFNTKKYQLGSASFVGMSLTTQDNATSIHISVDEVYKGRYLLHNTFRSGITSLFNKLSATHALVVLSGDNEGDKEILSQLVPLNTKLVFNKKPDEKLAYIKDLQDQGHRVMMIGDGLNDAGALVQSDVGVSISENINVFSPACDAILDATHFNQIDEIIALSKKGMRIIYMSFGLSILYNLVGLSYAISGTLSPIVAAIIMPLSSITVVVFVTVMSNWFARKLTSNSIT